MHISILPWWILAVLKLEPTAQSLVGWSSAPALLCRGSAPSFRDLDKSQRGGRKGNMYYSFRKYEEKCVLIEMRTSFVPTTTYLGIIYAD